MMASSGVQANAPSAYIDNGTVLQTGASFNIDGTGTAAMLNAVSQYQLNGAPLISVSGYLSQSLGYQAGLANTGNLNTFAGFLCRLRQHQRSLSTPWWARRPTTPTRRATTTPSWAPGLG